MMSGRLTKLCLAALLLAGVLLSTTTAAVTTTPAVTDDAAVDAGSTDDGAMNDGGKDDGTTNGGTMNDGGNDDGRMDDGGMDDGGMDDGMTDDGGKDDGTMDDGGVSDDGEAPTGGSSGAGDDATMDDNDAGATDQDDAETGGSDDDQGAGDDGDEGKAGTGKRSIGDAFNSFKDKASKAWEDAKEKIRGKYEENKEKFKKAMGSWSEKIKNKFKGLPDGIKDKIFKGNFSGLTDEEIDKLDKSQLRLLVPMNRLAALNSSLQEKVYERFKTLNDRQSMRRVLESMDVMDRTTLINRISEVNAKFGSNERAKERLVMGMADRLGDARNWTAAEVDLLKSKSILKYISPANLMRIDDTAILNKIPIPPKTEMNRMKPAMQKAWADFVMHKKIKTKEVSKWTSSDISGNVKSSLGMASLDTLRMIKNTTLYDAFTSAPAASTDGGSADQTEVLSDEKFGRKQGELLVKKLMSEFKKRTDKPTPNDVKTFANGRLGSPLLKFVEPEDLVMMVDPTLRNSSTMDDMLRSTLGNKKAARGKRCDVFRRTQEGVNLATLTAAQINTLVTDGSLGCAPLKYIRQWVEGKKLSFSLLTQAGLLTPGQLRAMAQTAANTTEFQKADGSLDLSKLPATLMSAAGPSDIKEADWSGLKNKIKTGAMLDQGQRAMYVHKGTASQVVDANLGPDYNELVPVVDMKGLSASKKNTAAMGAPPDSPLRMLSAAYPETALPQTFTENNADKFYQAGLPFMDVMMVAKRISTDDIQGVLEKLREQEDKDTDPTGNGGLSRRMCSMLKKSLANSTQLLYKDDDDDASILGTLTGAELGSLPPCVAGQLRYGMVEKMATDDQKMAILSSLGQVKPTQLKLMNKRNCHGLVSQGLKAMRSSGDLTVTEADKIGMAATCMEGKDIRRLDQQAFDSLRMYFQDGCINKDQANAVISQLIKYNGQPDGWMNLQQLCGLLPLMDDSQLREIPETRLAAACGQTAAASSSDSMARFDETAQMICKNQLKDADYSQLMERRENVLRRVARGVMMAQKQLMDELDTTDALETSDQAAAVARRRRRAAEPKLTCAAVQGGNQGAKPWTTSQLKDMDLAEIKMCQKELGSVMADKDKLKAVWDKLKEAYDNNAADVPMKNIGFVGTAIPTNDMQNLNLSTYDAVSAFGQPMMMSQEQLKELAKQAKSDWAGLSGEPANYVADNLLAAGQLLCGMDASDVAKIPSAQLKSALKKVSKAYWCQPAVTEKLAEKALEVNGGDPATLGKAEVNEMGAMIGGLEAMQLKAIKNESMGGLTAAGIKSIPPSKIEVLTAAQVRQFSEEAAYSVSDAQKDRMPEDAKMALKEVIQGSGQSESAADRSVAGAVMPLLVLALAVTRMI